ncbi:signal peptidase II [Desulfoprunum benzoelyticum]|uniref:Lipoprotein signal peptidase n=1 Tax=Desulfoprunum benzoelyticum TaxID=1506996 RepID=A0A840V195_9BACT|nr:signal peptidase II [Desulfoprunum benzoelyticum]MBB5347469.1 signal peptidase II [Desulfoprunum benzoelyticum]
MLLQPIRVVRLTALLLAILVSDQLSKWLAWRHLDPAAPLSLFHDTLRLAYVENSGGFLGLLGGLPEEFRFLLLIWGVALLIVPGIVYVLWRASLPRSMAVAALLVLGGGLSNLLDRLLHDGRVIDFLNFGLGTFRTGIFNLADVAILTGSFALGAIWFQRGGENGGGQGPGAGSGSRQ